MRVLGGPEAPGGPSVPWYFSFPFYVFPHPRLALGWAAAAVPVVATATVAGLVLYHARIAWAWRGGPAGRPSHATGHPAGAMVVYALVARIWPGVTAAALATVAVGSLGAVAAGGLARDVLGERGGRLALAVWVLAPGVVLYLATSADAVFAAGLGGAALAAHRGLARRSAGWMVAGGVLLWGSSMLTYAAVLLVVFLGVRAAGLLRADRAWVLRWAAGTSAVVVALAGGLWLVAGYDVPAAGLAVHGAYQAAPGAAGRAPGPW